MYDSLPDEIPAMFLLPSFLGIHDGADDPLYKRVHNRIDPLVPLYVGMYNPLFLEHREMLGYHRLWLLQTGPELGYTGFFLPGNHTEKFKPDRVPAYLQLLRALLDLFIGATIQ